MHPEILTDEQLKLLPLIRKFSRSYYLVGGTAIALIIGHRRSIDFDLFTSGRINKLAVSKSIARFAPKNNILLAKDFNQAHYKVLGVKITFFEFHFKIASPLKFEEYIRMPDLLTLAAMKAFAMGDRSKWKDYVDLYFLLKHHLTFNQIAEKANELFSEQFNPRLIREQLAYFNSIDYREEVEYIVPAPSNDEIKFFLSQVATQSF